MTGTGVIGLEDGMALAEFQCAHQLPVGALHDAGHAGTWAAVAALAPAGSLAASAVTPPFHPHQHGVAVPGFQGVFRRDVEILAARIGNHEAEAGG